MGWPLAFSVTVALTSWSSGNSPAPLKNLISSPTSKDIPFWKFENTEANTSPIPNNSSWAFGAKSTVALAVIGRSNLGFISKGVLGAFLINVTCFSSSNILFATVMFLSGTTSFVCKSILVVPALHLGILIFLGS